MLNENEPSRNPTIGQTIGELHRALSDYIEATYHISNPQLVKQRQALLQNLGVVHQKPYLESTPRYKIAGDFASLTVLDDPVLELFTELSVAKPNLPRRIVDPPYEHQATALRLALSPEHKSLFVTTGTGSGKTECFLLPILGKLASDAARAGIGFGNQPAVRALILYPMNALVNDQLGRLRLLFGDPRVKTAFQGWCGRPLRFARYTSRTLYPGKRTPARDSEQLRPIRDFYVRNLEATTDDTQAGSSDAVTLVYELKTRGKWPAKPDIKKWYGHDGQRWSKNGEYQRAVTLPDDSELFTRHEVQEQPPDLLVTNYSMLEYMLMRPIERSIFDETAQWLSQNPKERLILVIDEAHLYRGAAGAEVALLIRRLTSRLGITPGRLQVICTSASFADLDEARRFGAQLTGKDTDDFEIVAGRLQLRHPEGPGSLQDAQALCTVNLNRFYDSVGEEARLQRLGEFLEYRGSANHLSVAAALYEALKCFPPLSRLVNQTMQEALSLDELPRIVFPNIDPETASRALTVLIALGSLARHDASDAGLLPCRVHAFYRGLPGLWVCMDPNCCAKPVESDSVAGALYGQPRDTCECGARVLEFYTCRDCGGAYARAYTDNLLDPQHLWAEPGTELRTQNGDVGQLSVIDLLLEEPGNGLPAEAAIYDLVTGTLNPLGTPLRERTVYIKPGHGLQSQSAADKSGQQAENGEEADDALETADFTRSGEFRPCGMCGHQAAYGKSTVQDHQTAGDQPFAALIAKQLQVQPASPGPATAFAPLRGRKVLIFSDSRNMAARLAPALQMLSTRDVLRPLIVYGVRQLQDHDSAASRLSLEDMYLSTLIAAQLLHVRLRPELKNNENFNAYEEVMAALQSGALEEPIALGELIIDIRQLSCPQALLRDIFRVLTDRYYGLEALALASIVELPKHSKSVLTLPAISKVAEDDPQKLALARRWIRSWGRNIWLSKMPGDWWYGTGGDRIVGHKTGVRDAFLDHCLADTSSSKAFKQSWLPTLLNIFAEQQSGVFRLRGSQLSLEIGGTWSYCQACRSVHRPFPEHAICPDCGKSASQVTDPDSDPVFRARKGYYRTPAVEVLRPNPVPPLALIAREHTAQLNTAQAGDVFSRAERYELLFQDVMLPDLGDDKNPTAIDVLSCTTTMEVGIDIGALSGVALRNMPPARSNYQQRAGRAGRRGNAVATVMAMGTSDSHNEQYFSHPHEMIRGAVLDPKLNLNNRDIIQRHVTAYIIQRYYGDRIADLGPAEQRANLFEVLGTVDEFKGTDSKINRGDLGNWLVHNQARLRTEIELWLPRASPQRPSDGLETTERHSLLENLANDTLTAVDSAIDWTDAEAAKIAGQATAGQPDDTGQGKPEDDPLPDTSACDVEVTDEVGDLSRTGRARRTNLLDCLLDHGVLPRYAFPTDVATFYVFNEQDSTAYRHAFRYSPSQSLAVSLSQYAPGKEVWIDGKNYVSGAIYSPYPKDRSNAWKNRCWYLECGECRYSETIDASKGERQERRDCPACGHHSTLGPARSWMRPPGFAHRIDIEAGTSIDDQLEVSYATRAQLTAPSSDEDSNWVSINTRVRTSYLRKPLIVTNRGPREEGYDYCTLCGRVAAAAGTDPALFSPHPRPYPNGADTTCPGGKTSRGIVLGTRFTTDVLLASVNVAYPVSLRPGTDTTKVALRTLSEALARAACELLELDRSELDAEFRPALTPQGQKGLQAEVYLYDTLPGGAGFARRAGELGETVFQRALDLLKNCPEGDRCDTSCYRCLRSFKNRIEHDHLDRHIGSALLDYLLSGMLPQLAENRVRQARMKLFEDLRRTIGSDIQLIANEELDVPGIDIVVAPILAIAPSGKRLIIEVANPLAPGTLTGRLAELMEVSAAVNVMPVDELLIRRSLPQATQEVRQYLAKWR